MKAMVMFDASASSYEIQGELYQVRSIPGVKQVSLLRRLGGEAPAYCLERAVDAAAAAGLAAQVEAAGSRYGGYVSNLKLITYASA